MRKMQITELTEKRKNINAEFTENTEDAEEFLLIKEFNDIILLGAACKNSLH